MWALLLPVAAACIVYLLWLRLTRPRFLVNGRPVAMAPRHVPVLGHALALKEESRFHVALESLCDNTDSAVMMQLLWRQQVLIVDEKVIREVLAARPDHFSRNRVVNLSARHSFAVPRDGAIGLFAAEGEAWREYRKKLAPAFAPSTVRAMFPVIMDALSQQQDTFESAISTSDASDYALDVILRYAFGSSRTQIAGKTLRSLVTEWLGAIMARVLSLTTLWATPLWHLMPSERRLRLKLRPQVFDFCSDLIRAQEEDLKSATLFVRSVQGLTQSEIVGNAEVVLIAGHETTGSVAGWLLHYLAADESLCRRIRAEVETVAPGGWQTLVEAQLGQLTLCNKLVNEALRLRSPGPVVGFTCIENFTCKDTAGNTVEFQAGCDGFLLTRVPSLRSEGSELCIDRETKPHYAFGGGPRVCPGKSLAMTELLLWTAMVSSHDLEPRSEAPRELVNFAMIPESFKVQFKSA